MVKNCCYQHDVTLYQNTLLAYLVFPRTESTMNTTKKSSHSVNGVRKHDPTKNIKEKLQIQCSMVICLSCQIHEYIIPSAQYIDTIMSGKNGSRSPKMMGCKNCSHISTTINPNKQDCPKYPMEKTSVPNLFSFFSFMEELGIVPGKREENPSQARVA